MDLIALQRAVRFDNSMGSDGVPGDAPGTDSSRSAGTVWARVVVFTSISLLAITPAALATSSKISNLEPTLPTARLSTLRSEPVVKEVNDKKLGESILTTTAGFTLYSLSVEINGKFTCTGSCLSVWHPLLLAPTVKPTGPVRLGLIKRPDGSLQVTYAGHPLYLRWRQSVRPGKG